jgi:hypothetical protein
MFVALLFVVDPFRNAAGKWTIQWCRYVTNFFCWSHLEVNRFSRFLDEHFVFRFENSFCRVGASVCRNYFCSHSAFFLAKCVTIVHSLASQNRRSFLQFGGHFSSLDYK